MCKILSVLVLLFVLAALLPGYAPGMAFAQTGEETPTPVPTEEVPGLGKFPGSEALAALDSYRYRMTISAEGEAMAKEGDLIQMQMEGEYTREPQAVHTVFSIPEGEAGAENTPCGQARCEYIVVEGNGWLYNQETKTWAVEQEGALIAAFLHPGFFLGFLLASWPEEVSPINAHENLSGIDTTHYQWGPELEDIAAVFGGEVPGEIKGEVEELAFELWLANELGYPAKFSFILAGKDEEGKSGRAQIIIEVYDANTPIIIKVPEGAELAPQLDIPTPDDAQMLISSADTLMYSTAKSVEDMATFYREKLPGQGWTEDKESSFSMEGMASLTFKKDGQTLSILFSADEEGGKTNVMASLQEESAEE